MTRPFQDSGTNSLTNAFQAANFRGFAWTERGRRGMINSKSAMQIPVQGSIHSTDRANSPILNSHFFTPNNPGRYFTEIVPWFRTVSWNFPRSNLSPSRRWTV